MKNIFFLLIFIVLSSCADTTKKNEVRMEKGTLAPETLYKIVSVDDWNQSKNKAFVVKSEIDKEFIHLATKEQLEGISNKFWRGQEYIILELETKKLKGDLKHESNPGGTNLYYHLYNGDIPLDAVKTSSRWEL